MITEYYYNSQDQIIKYSHSGKGDIKTYKNIYDYARRLQRVDYYTGSPDAPDPEYTNLTEYEYTENSQVSQQLLNEGGIKNNYYYTNRNWIYSMQNNDGMFEYTNDYFKNGNVKSQEILGNYNNSFSYTSDLYFNYTYDRSNRLLKGTISAGKSYEIENTYDKDGNILTLKRYDYQGNYLDNFNYSYTSGTNKLRKVTGSADQYTYDQNGNMTSDEIYRNKNIKYDHRNLITELRHKELVLEDSIVYVTYYNYDEAGNRISKTVYRYTDSSEPSDTLSEEDVSISSCFFSVNTFECKFYL